MCIRGKKLVNQIGASFEIRNLVEICRRVIFQCYTCSLVQKLPCGTIRQPFQKDPVMLKNKNQAWSIDELQLIADTTGAKIGFSKILCATDLFSHFVVMQPVCGQLNGKQVADFIQLKIVAVFGVPSIIVTTRRPCATH